MSTKKHNQNIINFNKEKHKRLDNYKEQRIVTSDGTRVSVQKSVDTAGNIRISVLKIKEDR